VDSLAEDWARQFAFEFFEQWRGMWRPMPVEGMSDITQVMCGLGAIMQNKFGELWPVECRIGLAPVPARGPMSVSQSLQDMLPKPSLGFCVLQTLGHWMLLVSTDSGTS